MKAVKGSLILIVICSVLPYGLLFSQTETERTGLAAHDLMILFEGALGFPGGKIFDIEEGLFSIDVAYENGEVKTAKPAHIVWNYGLTLEYILTGRIGIQAGYHLRSISQSMGVGTSGYETPDQGGTLIEFDNPFTGCVYHAAMASLGSLYFAVRIGSVVNGMLYPMPAAYDYFGEAPDKYKLTGFSYNFGAGGNLYYNHFVFGLSCFYTGYKVSLSEKIYYDLEKDFTFNSFDLCFSIGAKISLF